MTPLLELYKQYTGCTADNLQCIAGSGSNRVYYRMQGTSGTSGTSVTEPKTSVTEPVEVPELN